MSFWDKIGKAIGDTLGGAYHSITGTPNASEVRENQYAVNDQIKAYKEATALSQKQLQETQAATAVEKRRINEKQIRALRNNFRTNYGFLQNQKTQSSASTESGLPNKLGA